MRRLETMETGYNGFSFCNAKQALASHHLHPLTPSPTRGEEGDCGAGEMERKNLINPERFGRVCTV